MKMSLLFNCWIMLNYLAASAWCGFFSFWAMSVYWLLACGLTAVVTFWLR